MGDGVIVGLRDGLAVRLELDCEHDDDPAVDVSPLVQGEQTLAPEDENVFAGHREHAVAAAPEYLPAAHCKHEPADWYVPAGQLQETACALNSMPEYVALESVNICTVTLLPQTPVTGEGSVEPDAAVINCTALGTDTDVVRYVPLDAPSYTYT